jgi:hypothetical protein
MCLAPTDPLIDTVVQLGVNDARESPNRFFVNERTKPLKRLRYHTRPCTSLKRGVNEMGYSTGTLNTSQTLFGSVAWSRKFDFLVDLEGELIQLGLFQTDLGGDAGDTPATTVNRLALHKLSDEIF